jgi:hypothetical protein
MRESTTMLATTATSAYVAARSAYGRTKRLLAALSVPALGLVTYFFAIRPSLLHWGATPADCPIHARR